MKNLSPLQKGVVFLENIKCRKLLYNTNVFSQSLTFLNPEGFVKRTAGVGLVVPSWDPQVPRLCQEAIGNFLSHCRCNSTSQHSNFILINCVITGSCSTFYSCYSNYSSTQKSITPAYKLVGLNLFEQVNNRNTGSEEGIH